MTTKSVATTHLRSVVLAGHAGAGKTTLAEALLFRAGATPPGTRRDGTASLDFEREEQKRRIAVPGRLRRSTTRATSSRSSTRRAARTSRPRSWPASRRVDSAIMLRRRHRRGGGRDEAAIALGRANRTAALSSSTNATARTPSRAASSTRCESVRDEDRARSSSRSARRTPSAATSISSTGKAYRWNRQAGGRGRDPGRARGRGRPSPRPAPRGGAEADDDVIVKYLEGEEISDAELDACLHRGVRDSLLAPVLVATRHEGHGLRGLLDAIVRYLPTPADGAARDRPGAEVGRPARDRPVTRTARSSCACWQDDGRSLLVGRLTYLRVVCGTLRSQTHAWNAERGEDERIGRSLAPPRQGQDSSAI